MGDQVEKNEMGRTCGTYGAKVVYRVLFGKREGKRPLGRPRSRWEDIYRDLQAVGWGAWTGSIWLRIGTEGGHLWMR